MIARPSIALRRCLQKPVFSRGFALTANQCRKPSAIFTSRVKSLQPSTAILTKRSFRTTTALARPSGTVDEELVAKLESEINVETQMGEYDDMPANVKDYLESGPFKLNDRSGMQEVELVRRFGDETIRVVFSIADLNTMDDKFEDSSLYEGEDASEIPEETEALARKDRSGKASTTAVTSSEEDDQEFEETNEPAYPARLDVTIEKPSQGAVQVEAIAQDGMIIIENVHYHKSAQLATAKTAEADWERRGHYVGPPFGNLDEDLQVLLERYLDERGVNTALAMFVPDYIDYKEQKEYMSWLKNLKSFVQE